MTESNHSGAVRWYRRVRRWARHTPNGEIAFTMITAGAVLLVAAGAIGYLAR